MSTVLFPGSFDPFTLGHADIVKRGLALFDNIVIGVGVNEGKQAAQSADKRVQSIAARYESEPRVSERKYSGLTVDFAREIGASAILRGLRNLKDFEYERDIAAVNKQLTGIETVLLFCASEYAAISSSLVRELQSYGKDVSAWMPTKDANSGCTI